VPTAGPCHLQRQPRTAAPTSPARSEYDAASKAQGCLSRSKIPPFGAQRHPPEISNRAKSEPGRYTPQAERLLLAIDINPAERPLRTIAITGKISLFLGSYAGGERATVVNTVLQSAKLNVLEPEAYFNDVIDRTVKGHPTNELSEFPPWNCTKTEIKLAA